MIKVLHIIWSAHFGGIEKLVHEISEAQFYQKGVEPAIFIPKAQGDMLPLFEKLPVPIFKGSFRSGWDFSPGLYTGVKKLMADFDVLHFHGFNPIIARAAAQLKKPIVYTEHGNFALGRKPSKADKLLLRLRTRFLNKKVKKLIFNSYFTSECAFNNMNLSSSINHEVVYNGVTHKNLVSTPDPSIADWDQRFVIGTAARFAKFKRLSLLIEAFAQMEQKNAQLLMVGDGPLRNSLEQTAKDLNVSDRVRFTGYQSNVGAFIHTMDVFVVPSINEPFGLTVIEVMGAGKPVLVFEDGGGARELVEQQNPANVLPDVSAMTKRLDYLQSHPEELLVGEEERRKFALSFSIEQHTARLKEVYQETINV